jgi:hypothetical protein
VDRLIDLYTDGGLDREDYDRKMAYIKQECQSIEAAIAEIQDRAAKQEAALANIHKVEDLCSRIQESLPFDTYEDKREFLDALNVRIRLDGDRIAVEGLLTESAIEFSLGGTREKLHFSKHLR